MGTLCFMGDFISFAAGVNVNAIVITLVGWPGEIKKQLLNRYGNVAILYLITCIEGSSIRTIIFSRKH